MHTEAPFESRAADWLTYEEARARILAAAQPLGSESVTLDEALDRVLSERVEAAFRMPPWDNSAMDGFAVRSADLRPGAEVELTVIGDALAGGEAPPSVGAGHAVRIMTGAPLPVGADQVVRVEDTEQSGQVVRVRADPSSGQNIRSGGEDFAEGDTLLEPHDVVTPARLGVLAASGRTHLAVHRRPRIVVLTAGDELLAPGSVAAVAEGRGVIDSNGPMLRAQARSCGALVESTPTLPDRADVLEVAIREAASRADVLLTVGGASVGAHDLFKRVLDGLGYRPDFWRIRMRPGSPVSFGTLTYDGRVVPVLGLPGNPSSAFVTFELFARPLLQRLGGRIHIGLRMDRVRAGSRLRGAQGLTVFARVRMEPALQGEWVAHPSGPQGSGLISPLARADALALIPPTPGEVPAGAPLTVLWLSEPVGDGHD
ncbi:MAG: molybdopterin molybdotransferase MoeA [Gemmatimonadota bacterium]